METGDYGMACEIKQKHMLLIQNKIGTLFWKRYAQIIQAKYTWILLSLKLILQYNTILVYYWGVKGTSANIYSIIDVTAYEKTSPIEVLLYFKDGAGRGITNPYIIATIPKTRHKKIVFNG